MSTCPTDLPVESGRANITKFIRNHRVCLFVGETGSGKTTKVPQYILDDILAHETRSGSKAGRMVGVTQPRRVAAITIANFVAQERWDKYQVDDVGYAVRFDDHCTSNTLIKYMTDGILLREILTDPNLTKYGAIVLDEAHERTLHGDVLFGLLKDLLRRRPDDLRIIVMSATLNADAFLRFWETDACGYVQGRQHPVTIYYSPEPVENYVVAAVTTCLQIVLNTPKDEAGDVLVFLTGAQDIEDAYQMLMDRRKRLVGTLAIQYDFEPFVLYAQLSQERQLAVFTPLPPGKRKIILSTNIAETSLTIPGVRFVVDCGFVKEKAFAAGTGIETLHPVPVSRAQAVQRTGRAGREGPGTCYRLYTEEQFFLSFREFTTPEIQRCSTLFLVLTLKSLGVENPLEFEFMDPPQKEAIVSSMETLVHLGALDYRDGSVTPLGKEMVLFPLEPFASKAVVNAGKCQNSKILVAVATIVAMLSVENLVDTHNEDRHGPSTMLTAFTSPYGDHFVLLNVAEEFRKQKPNFQKEWCKRHGLKHRELKKALDICQQILEMSQSLNGGSGDDSDEDSSTVIRRALVSGYFSQSAIWDQSRKAYVTLLGRHVVYLHPSSVLFHRKERHPVVMYNTLVKTTKLYMRDVCVINEKMLQEAAPRLFQVKEN
eukprot:PhF_6_TR14913/c0_g1_i2/m.23301